MVGEYHYMSQRAVLWTQRVIWTIHSSLCHEWTKRPVPLWSHRAKTSTNSTVSRRRTSTSTPESSSPSASSASTSCTGLYICISPMKWLTVYRCSKAKIHKTPRPVSPSAISLQLRKGCCFSSMNIFDRLTTLRPNWAALCFFVIPIPNNSIPHMM